MFIPGSYEDPDLEFQSVVAAGVVKLIEEHRG